MRRGFTLVELLAVIVILSIIALIAVPIVINIINDVKEESAKRSISLYKDLVEKAIINKNYKTKFDPDECIVQENTKLKCSKEGEDYEEELEIEMKGSTPTNGIIKIENGKIVKIKDLLYENNWYRYEKNIYKTQALPTNPGLYDEDYNLLASWQDLVDIYHLNIENDYTYDSYKQKNSGSMYDVLKNNNKLKKGTVLIVKEDIDNIGSYAFAGCSNLEYIKLSNEITRIKESTFRDCSKLSNITIPDGVIFIGNAAFYNCSNLEKVIIPNSLTALEGFSFAYSGIKYINLPDSITSIWDSSFRNCTNLKKIKLSSNLTQLRDGLFRDCTSLKSIVIPKNITNISGAAFIGCSNLESIKVEEGNTIYEDRGVNAIIKKNANILIKGSNNTVIPNDITEIFQNAFYGSNIDNIIIPNSVIQIGDQAFKNCINLKTVIFENTTGWYLTYFNTGEHIDIDVTNAKTNASNLKSVYYNKQWKRS